MVFPDSFLRGISEKDYVNNEGSISSVVFHFGEKNNQPQRQDDNHEESIFWKDNDGAIKLLFSQRKEGGKIQFRGGAVVVDRQAVDLVRKLPFVKSQLTYERNIIDKNNPYHGNLLLHKSVDKSTMKKIAAAIALCCIEHLPQD